jgi:hypothetical protein
MYNNGEYVIVNSAGNIVGDRFDEILGCGNGCLSFVIRKGDKRGFLSTESGKKIFAPQFDRAWIDKPKFGLAAVVVGSKLGFVNVKTGKMSIEPQFDFEGRHLYYDFIFQDNGYCTVPGKDVKFGIIDTTGQIIIPTVYDDIDYLKYGFTKLRMGDKYALYDSIFNLVLPMGYDYLSVNELGIVALKEHTQQLLDFKGQNAVNNYWIDQIEYEEYISHLYEPSSNDKYDYEGSRITGKLSPYLKFQVGDYYGVFDASYKIIIPPIYRELEYNGNGFFSCSIDGNGAIIIDSNGQWVHGKN